jgi:hypothetical protein
MDVSRVKKIDRKLKKCLNAEFIPGTEEYALRFRFLSPPFPFSFLVLVVPDAVLLTLTRFNRGCW